MRINNMLKKMFRSRLDVKRAVLFIGATLVATTSLSSVGLAHASSISSSYTKTTLVSDLPGVAPVLDAKLVNPWGLSSSPTGPWWISDNGSGSSSVYTSSGTSVLPAVSIPSPTGVANGGTPTGNIFNSAAGSQPTSFVIRKGLMAGPSNFMFATEDGTILGWNRSVDSASAIIAVNRSAATDSNNDTGAVYKGLAAGSFNSEQYIYATNFRFGTIEMFDKHFQLVKSFTDSQLSRTCPLPGQCYSPFGIQNIKGNLYVSFALQDAQKHDDQKGSGHGFVDVFDTNGHYLRRLISHGSLNSPWGLALAPNGFGRASDHLLVGNFGDGHINVYDIYTGGFDGRLKDASGRSIQADGLWGLAFGNNGLAGMNNELFFTAGIRDEAHGVFGKITKN